MLRARQILGYDGERYASALHSFAIMRDHVVERAYGWVFSFNPRRYLETGDSEYMLGGNGPLLVSRATGRIVQLPTRRTSETLKPYDKDPGLVDREADPRQP